METTRIPLRDMVDVIRVMHDDAFRESGVYINPCSFFLAQCGQCGAPSWQQPCPACGFYPLEDWHQAGPAKKELLRRQNHVPADAFSRMVKNRGNIGTWYFSEMKKTVAYRDNRSYADVVDRLIDKTRSMTFPEPAEIWEQVVIQQKILRGNPIVNGPASHIASLIAKAHEDGVGGNEIRELARQGIDTLHDQAGINMDKPPFVLVGDTRPEDVASIMVSSYRRLAANPKTSLERIFNTVMDQIGIDRNDALFVAGRRIAREMDVSSDRNSYHNRAHTREVLLNSHFLALRNAADPLSDMPLKPHDRALIAVAALIHDLDHDGTRNDGVPFRLEKRSLENAEVFFTAWNVDIKDRARIRTLVLSTDPDVAPNTVKAVHAAHFDKGPKADPSDHAFELAPLSDPRLSRMSAIIRDADILSSAGLTPDYAKEQTLKLGREWNKAITPADTMAFLTHVVGDRFISPEARFFAPNLETIRQAARGEISKKLTPPRAKDRER